jgi:hypothetical protein
MNGTSRMTARRRGFFHRVFTVGIADRHRAINASEARIVASDVRATIVDLGIRP